MYTEQLHICTHVQTYTVFRWGLLHLRAHKIDNDEEKPDKEGRDCYNKEQNGPQVTSLEDGAAVYQGVKFHRCLKENLLEEKVFAFPLLGISFSTCHTNRQAQMECYKTSLERKLSE